MHSSSWLIKTHNHQRTLPVPHQLIIISISLISSEASIQLTLWNAEAENFSDYSQPVLLVKGARVGEFAGGKSILFIGSTMLQKNSNLQESHDLRGWFANGGGRNVRNSVSAQIGNGNSSHEWLTFREATRKNLGNGDKADFFQNKSTITLVGSTSMLYKACPQENCNKKVVELENG